MMNDVDHEIIAHQQRLAANWTRSLQLNTSLTVRVLLPSANAASHAFGRVCLSVL